MRGSEKLSENVVLVRSDEEFRPPRKSSAGRTPPASYQDEIFLLDTMEGFYSVGTVGGD